MLFDAERPTGIPDGKPDIIGLMKERRYKINCIETTSDHKWLFAGYSKGWWAIFDIEQDK
jgi:hypothetical protein